MLGCVHGQQWQHNDQTNMLVKRRCWSNTMCPAARLVSRAPLEEGLSQHVLRYLLEDFAGKNGLDLLLTMLFVEAAVHSAGGALLNADGDEVSHGDEVHNQGAEGVAEAEPGGAASVAGQPQRAANGSDGGLACSRRYETLLMDALQGLRYANYCGCVSGKSNVFLQMC